MNPTDKFEQIQIYKRLNPIELEAMVLKHEQEIKDIAKHLLALNKKEKKEWVGLTEEEAQQAFNRRNCDISKDLAGILARAIEAKLKEKNK